MSKTFTLKGEHFYECLGVTKDATQEDIKIAYKKLALKYHPDKNLGNPEADAKFKEINHAYNILKDDKKRQIYDQFGNVGLQLSEQFGEENFSSYVAKDGEIGLCCSCLLILSFCFTGCCFCWFCCGNCCCNMCCHKCDSEKDNDPKF